MILIISVDLLLLQGRRTQYRACVIHVTNLQVIILMHFPTAMKEELIFFSESCFRNSCPGFREKSLAREWMLRVLHIKGHSEIT